MEKIGIMYWNVAKASSKIGISPETLSRWIRLGYIKASKRSDKSYNVPIRELVVFIISHYAHLPKKFNTVQRAKNIKNSLF